MSHFPEANRGRNAIGGRPNRRSWRVGLIALVWLAALSTSGASAQARGPGGVLLVSDADVPSALERSVKRKLGQVADVLDTRAYESAVKAARLTPGSDAALSKLGPRAGAEVIVHLGLRESGDLQAEIRSGQTGAVRSTLEFPLQAQGRRFKRPSRALRELVAGVQEGMSSAAPERNADHHFDNHADDLDDEANESPSNRPPAADSSSAPVRAENRVSAEGSMSNSSSGDEQIMEDPELREHVAASSSERDAGPRQGLGLQASVGVGPGSHALHVPVLTAPNAVADLETGVAPAIELAAAAELGFGSWLFRAEGQYRTFFGNAPAPIPSDVSSVSGMTPTQTAEAPLTSHSFTIGASPGYRFGGRNSVAVLLMLGWTYRSLQASVATLPSGSFNGLVMRPTLYVPFGDGVFCFRFAPELIVLQNSESTAPGTALRASAGTGFGVEAAVDVRLAKLLGAGLQFRRSRVVAAGNSTTDEEWYVSVQAVLSL